jgi:hypothetical protein
MTKSAARCAIAGGRNARVFSRPTPTNLKSLHHKPKAGAAFGAGLSIICRNNNAQRIADIQTDGFASRY